MKNLALPNNQTKSTKPWHTALAIRTKLNSLTVKNTPKIISSKLTIVTTWTIIQWANCWHSFWNTKTFENIAFSSFKLKYIHIPNTTAKIILVHSNRSFWTAMVLEGGGTNKTKMCTVGRKTSGKKEKYTPSLWQLKLYGSSIPHLKLDNLNVLTYKLNFFLR